MTAEGCSEASRPENGAVSLSRILERVLWNGTFGLLSLSVERSSWGRCLDREWQCALSCCHELPVTIARAQCARSMPGKSQRKETPETRRLPVFQVVIASRWVIQFRIEKLATPDLLNRELRILSFLKDQSTQTRLRERFQREVPWGRCQLRKKLADLPAELRSRCLPQLSCGKTCPFRCHLR